ncbi:shikimate dehydrogenase [Halobaculum sp. CBA1158]|uniref:shikimate dehydrogenase family protein n=1 Tax=Halobaculum sp. CBA1158 TaxID=2904243 RepID=UPI001F2668B3|nr:shikimate dehydrogenase [Halobaculum sp. CBA1158]UIP00211.1 shikimate dehydrogenase [Halobaculum sp. CBA1158]
MDVYGLIGNPVGHSLSPPMHEAAYDALDVDARYVALEPDADEGAAAVEAAATLGMSGLNVTVPFKRDVLAAVEPSDLAAAVGAVNTVDFAYDPPRGYNTDVSGVRRAFGHHGVEREGAAVVVGAGGAGRAAAFALAEDVDALHVANRTAARAEELAGEVREALGATRAGGADDAGDADADPAATPPTRVTAGGLDTLAGTVPSADLLVNATTVGMESDETPVPAEHLHGDMAVLDAVYAPLDTRLLREARAAGATAVDGAWMLLYQGVEAFERWTDRDAPVGAMNGALRDALDRSE